MQIVKGLGRLQEQTLAASTQATPATGAEEKTGDESAPMEVDKDTGGVRHSKAEQYLPKIPMLNYEKMVSRSSEINYWTEYVEAISSWLALLDDFYPVELYRASITDSVVRQDALEKGPAARSSRFHNLLKQSLGSFQHGLDVVRQAEQQQMGTACGYEAFRKLNLEFGIQSRMEASAIRESVLSYRPGKHLHRPLDIYRAVEAELLKTDRNLNSYPSVRLPEAEKVMLHFRCMPESCKHYVLLHGKSETLDQVLASIKFYDSHLRLIGYEKEIFDSHTAAVNHQLLARLLGPNFSPSGTKLLRRKPHKFIFLSHGKHNKPSVHNCLINSELDLVSALRRRALAFDLVGILSYDVANRYHQALIQRLQEAPPPGYSKVSTAQVLRADRAAFLKIAENITSLRRSGTGVLPLDAQLPTILLDPSVTYHLLPLPAGASSSGQGRDDDKPDRPPKRPHDPPRRPPKKGAKRTNFSVPKELIGKTHQTPKGHRLWWGFNLPCGCKDAKPGGKCAKGLHLCAEPGCLKPHSLQQHGSA